MNADKDRSTEFCNICHIGSPRSHRATYARWHYGQFIVLSGMPAWRCDVCGDTFYDDQALARLFLLLGPESAAEGQHDWRAVGLEGHREPGLGDRHRV